jgi:hypothetical protein
MIRFSLKAVNIYNRPNAWNLECFTSWSYYWRLYVTGGL